MEWIKIEDAVIKNISDSLSKGDVVGIIFGVVVFLVVLFWGFFKIIKLKKKKKSRK